MEMPRHLNWCNVAAAERIFRLWKVEDQDRTSMCENKEDVGSGLCNVRMSCNRDLGDSRLAKCILTGSEHYDYASC